MDRAPLPRAFWWLFAGTLVNRLGGFVFSFLAIYLTEQRHFSVAHAGVVVALYGLGSMGAGLLGGALADRVGRRSTMAIGLLGGAVAMMHLASARHPLHIALATLLVGLVGDLYRPAMSAAVADVVPPAQRARAYGLTFWAVNLGFAVAVTLGGVVARGGFLWLFLADAATSVAAGLLLLRFVPETRPPAPATGSGSGAGGPLRDHLYLALVAASFLVVLPFYQSPVALPLDMAAQGIAPRQFGALMALNGVLIVLLQPGWSRIVGRLPRARVLAAAALLVGAGFGATALVTTPAGYAATIVLWTLGEIGFTPAMSTLVADLAPTGMRGRYQGVFQLIYGGASVIGPSAGSWVLGQLGHGALWGGCLAVAAAGGCAHLALERAQRRRIGASVEGGHRLD